MDCTETQDRLSEYQDGSLTESVSETLVEHLQACPACATAHSLAVIRDGLARLPLLPAPPELFARVQAAIAGEADEAASPAAVDRARGTFFSRFRLPLEVAAAVLLFASVYWYRTAPVPVPRATAPVVSNGPVVSAPAAPAAAPTVAPTVTPAALPANGTTRAPARKPVRTAKPHPAAVIPPSPAPTASAAPEEAHHWASAELPAVPALRASTNAERITLGSPPAREPAFPSFGAGRDANLEPRAADRPLDPFAAFQPFLPGMPANSREVLLDVGQEHREGAEDRIAAVARRLGGIAVVAQWSTGNGPTHGAVRVVVPEAAGPLFLMELGQLGSIPSDGKPQPVDLHHETQPRNVSYTVRIRTR
jgi:hypothetical protein